MHILLNAYNGGKICIRLEEGGKKTNTIENGGWGRGSCLIPLTSNLHHVFSASNLTPPTSNSTGGFMSKILIIDDDVDIVEAIKIVLESKGHKTITAYEGEEGYKKAEAERPDLIILDVVMKTKDQGFQISYKLKNHPELSKIPILMLTSVGRETGFRFNKETDEDYLPVDDFVEKPVKPNELLSKVNKLLKHK